MLYQYTATDQGSKTVRGSIDAPTIDQARQILTDRGMEVTELSEARHIHEHAGTEQVQPSLKTTFAFEGADATGVIRRGTLQADSKYEAFEHLRESQNLTLSMLSPVGITPQYHDRELESWQNRGKKSVAQTTPVIPPAPFAQPTAKKLGFIGVRSSPVVPQVATSPSTSVATLKTTSSPYLSLLSTLRLYAGWLLAWYAVFVACGYYVHGRSLPFTIPFVEAFYLSSFMYSITVATFMFLLLSTIHRTRGGSIISGVLLTIAGIACFLFIRSNIAF